jgi:mRNA-degrading endonuclease toxin of MazEF toxin-antitoxin module
VLVITNDIGNTYAETLNVLPMTSQLKKPDLPCHTKLDPEIISDKHRKWMFSMILAEQIHHHRQGSTEELMSAELRRRN